MTKFAAHDEHSIYALGDTAEIAVSRARRDNKDPDGHYSVTPITDDLAAWINENGWDGYERSFSIRDGVIVDTTRGKLNPHVTA